jgi:glycosyltransferase involved in cell wall biosynthesis
VDEHTLRLGFACSWWTPRASTWSGTPGALESALRRQPIDLVSIDAQRSLAGKVLLRALYSPTSTPWKYSRLNRALAVRRIRTRVRRARCDAVVSMADDDAAAGVPTFAYQDMNFSVALEHVTGGDPRLVTVLPASPRLLAQLVEEQRRNYDSISAVLVMGTWFRDWLVERQGLDPSRVAVVGGGITNLAADVTPPTSRGRLLFLGADFHRKGGDQVLAAVDLLRQRGHDVTLTVAGPRRWPLPGNPPAWVEFAGYVDGPSTAALWAGHDTLVMPSRFEAHGIAFSEALAAGRPCVGRRVFAMPELIGDGGRLVDAHAGVEELAETITGALADDALFERVWQNREGVRRERSWDAVAGRIVAVVGASANIGS